MMHPDDIPIGSKGTYIIPEDEILTPKSKITLKLDFEDEQPLSAKGIYELADNQIPEDQETNETGPLETRVNSKNWKTRSKAYEELIKLLSQSTDLCSEYAGSVVKFLSDSNPAAQEKALEIANVYIKTSPALLVVQNETIVKSLIEKGIASPKPGIKNESMNLLLDFFASHKDNFEGFISGIFQCLSNKNLKIQVAGISVVNHIIASFGIQKLQFKPFVNIMEKLAGASNPQLRGEALNFYKETYRWVRDLIKPYIEKLKKPQQDELQKAFEEIKDIPVPSRWLRHEEAKAKAEIQSSQGKPSKPIDIYEMADAKDIFTKYNEKWVNSVLSMEKWVDKKQALEDLNNEANYPKLAEKSPIELVTLAKKLINDSNVQVMVQAMKLVGLLSKGQRKYFESYSRQFFPLIIQKFKDKKTQVVMETHNCLDNMMFSLSIDSVQEEIKSALEDPNPLVKSNTCAWLERVVMALSYHEIKNICKLVTFICKKNTDDSSPEVRSCTFKLLSCLVVKCPEVLGIIKDLPQAKMKKIEELAGKNNSRMKIDTIKTSDPDVPKNNIEKLLAPGLIVKISDQNWKVRKEGLDEVENILDNCSTKIQPSGLESLVKALVGRIVDSNKSIARQALLLSSKLAKALGPDSKVFAKQLLPGIINSLADKQNLLRQDAMISINRWAEEAGADIVIVYSAGPLNTDNPELRSELLRWLLDHKGYFKDLDMKSFITGTLACLQDRSAQIRTLAESFFSEIVEIVGFEAFQPYLKDIKPAVMNGLNAIFDKYKHRSCNEGELNESIVFPPKPPRSGVCGASKERSTSKDTTLKKPRMSVELEVKSPLKKSRTSIGSSIEIGIVSVGNKEKRLEIESKNKWNLEDIRPDFQEKLKEHMKAAFSPELFVLLQSLDFKKQIEGVSYLSNLIHTSTKEIIEILDIIFRWVWIKLQEAANTQLIKVILDLIQNTINVLHKENYTLHDIEANLFLPIFCDKSGQNNVQFKTVIRGIIHSTCKVYAPEKVFVFVLAGCNSKNTKSKVECLEELAVLVQDYGPGIAQSKDIKFIAKHANSPDNNVRASAVQTLGEIYKHCGDKIWISIGEVTSKVRDLLDQRFKAVAGTSHTKRLNSRDSSIKVPSPRSSRCLKSVFEDSRSLTPFTYTLEDPLKTDRTSNESERKLEEAKSQKQIYENMIIRPHSEERQDFKDKKNDFSSCERKPGVLPRASEFRPKLSRTIEPDIPANKALKLFEDQRKDYEHNELVDESLLYDPIKFNESGSELERNIEALKTGDMSSKVDALVAINDMILNNLDSHKEELQKKANILSEALTKLIISTFDKPVKDIPLRFAKYFLNVLHKVCSTKIIMRELNESTLNALSEQILSKLIIENLEKIGEKGEGETMLKTLNGTMLRLLENTKPTRIILVLIRLMTKYKSGVVLPKIPGLIVRCLLKLAKVMSTFIHQIEIDKVLLAMHEYLIQNKIATGEDLGCKTLKSLLTEIVKLQGNAIRDAYEVVRHHHTPDLQIDKWITIMLSNTNYQSNPVYTKEEIAINDIFTLIRQDYNAGIQKLLEFIDKNPSFDFSSHMSALPSNLNARVHQDLLERKEKRKSSVEDNSTGGYNYNDLRKRLSTMKEKFGILNTGLYNEPSNTLNDLKIKVNTLLSKNPPVEDQNTVADLKTRIQGLARFNK